jgi:hypothetical protein
MHRAKLSRILDLGNPGDRKELRHACQHDPVLAEAVDLKLGSYLTYFTAPVWRTVYGGGMIGGPAAGGVFDLFDLLVITAKLDELSRYEGFDLLVAGLENRTQTHATMFEIASAFWCTQRTVHSDLLFAPEVPRGSRVRRCDFKWTTTLGTIWAECKEASIHETKGSARLSRLGSALAAMLEDRPFEDTYRLDITLTAAVYNGAEHRLRQALAQIADLTRIGRYSESVTVGEVSAILNSRATTLPTKVEVRRMMQLQVGPTPVRVDEHAAYFSLSIDVGGERAKRAANLIREARQQLPTDEPSVVFLSDVGSRSAAQVAAKHVNLPGRSLVWVLLWQDGQPVRAIWRPNQTFDGRLLAPDGYRPDSDAPVAE